MAIVYYRSKQGLSRLLEEHGPEGVAILTDRPSRLIRGALLVLLALLIAAMLWSFYSTADVIVQGQGTVQPALAGASQVLEIEIDERDRALLRPGMSVRVKLNAFPYQRYGILKGELEHIALASNINRDSKQTVYKARVGLERDYFTVNDVATPIHPGMTAQAEIVVDHRRLIDLALDPFTNAGG